MVIFHSDVNVYQRVLLILKIPISEAFHQGVLWWSAVETSMRACAKCVWDTGISESLLSHDDSTKFWSNLTSGVWQRSRSIRFSFHSPNHIIPSHSWEHSGSEFDEFLGSLHLLLSTLPDLEEKLDCHGFIEANGKMFWMTRDTCDTSDTKKQLCGTQLMW